MNQEERQQMEMWLEKKKHLPAFLKDFHDQKDVFKTIGGMSNPPHRDIGWVEGHCYTIDKFLWWMAIHGYTLQKCKAKQPYKDMNKTIQIRKDKEIESFRQFLSKEKKD